MKIIPLKKEILIILFGIIINILASQYNLNKFDKIVKNHEGVSYNQITGSDLLDTWEFADKFKNKISETNNFFKSLPHYERFYLPSIIVGFYYHIIDKEIYETIDSGEKVVKTDNYKNGILLIQILLYYMSVYLLVKELRNKYKINYHFILLVFLSLEPTLIQWHHSFWNESIFLSMMIFLFYLLIKNSNNFILNLIIGFLVALMFAQRAVSFFYILPVIIYYLLINKKNLKSLVFLILGFSSLMFLIGFNNYNKTDNFYFVPSKHQYYSYYYYFGTRIFADKQNVSREEAQDILDSEEEKWRTDNNIYLDLEKRYNEKRARDDSKLNQDYLKAIDYRNKKFFEIAISNPIYVTKLFLKRVLLMSQFSPTWVIQSYNNDRTSPEAKINAASYYNKNLIRNGLYSLCLYVFVLFGFLNFFKNFFIKRNFSPHNKFLLFQIISISYFLLIAGFWGNPKYFVPCIINLSFFFAKGLSLSIDHFKKKS